MRQIEKMSQKDLSELLQVTRYGSARTGIWTPLSVGPRSPIVSATGPLRIQEWPHPAGKEQFPRSWMWELGKRIKEIPIKQKSFEYSGYWFRDSYPTKFRQVLMQPPLLQGSSLSRPAALRSPASLQHSRDGGAEESPSWLKCSTPLAVTEF